MKSIKFSDFVQIVNPKYLYIQLIPNYSIRNNSTYKLARTINSFYQNIFQCIQKDHEKAINILGKEFLVGTKYSINTIPKVSYYIYVEKSRIHFYLIIPEKYHSIIKEKINDTWQGVTSNVVDEIPEFNNTAIKYQLCYTKENGLSLAVDRRANELLESNLNIVDVLEQDDKVGIFYNFIPTSQFGWRSSYYSTIEKMKKNIPVDRNKVNAGYIFRMALSIVSDLVDDITSAFAGKDTVIRGNDTITALERALSLVNSKPISNATIRKGNDIVIDTQILAISESKNRLRERNNAKSLTQSFDSISEDNSLVGRPYRGNLEMLKTKLSNVDINKFSTEECGNFLSLPGRGLLERYNFIEKTQTQETEVPGDLREGVMCLGESIFKGSSQPAYLSNDFDYRMLSLVLIGPNRAGKSKFLANIARDAIHAGECVVIPDFIGSCQLSEEIASVFPKEKVLRIKCDNYATMQGLGYNEVPPSNDPFRQYKNAKEQTALLMTLIDSINAEDANFTAKMGRYMESASLAVFLAGGSINDVFSVLMNHKKRKEFVENIPPSQATNMEEYVDYLLELDNVEKGKVVGTRSHYITGAIDRLHRLKVNAYLEMMLKKGIKNNVNLVKEMQKNQLIVIEMPQRMFLTDNEKDVYVTYWLTKLWLSLQIREQQIRNRKKMTKVNLIIDELYQVNNAEKFLTWKLSQLPKFNLKPIISCHYLNQIRIIREELRSANASYMLLSGCDKKNYTELESELYPYKEEDLLSLKRYHSLNLIKCNEGYGKFITKLPVPITV